MPDFNFKPAVTFVRFYRSQRGLPEDERITEVRLKDFSDGGIDIFELYIEITLSGLDSLINPMSVYMLEEGLLDGVESIYEPFYVNVVSYTQRGQRDTVIHGLTSSYIDEDVLKKGNVSLVSFVDKFRNDIPLILPDDKEPIKYNNVTNIYFVKIFYSTEKIIDENQLRYYMWDSYYNLFSTKIPLYLPGEGGYYNGE